MSTAVFLTNNNDAKTMIPWGARFAHAGDSELLIVVPRKSKGKQSWHDVPSEAEVGESVLLKSVFQSINSLDSSQFGLDESRNGEEPLRTRILVREIESPDPERAFAEAMMDLDVQLLIIPAHEPTKAPSTEDSWIYKLLVEAPCETMIIRGPYPDSDEPLRVVVATEGELDTDVALYRARQLTEKYDGELSLLFVRPDDDKFAMHVAKYQLDRLDRNVRVDLSELPKTISLQESFSSATRNHCAKNNPHLVLVGTRNLKRIKNLLRPFDAADSTVAVAAIRDGVPFSSRLLNEIRLWLRARIPQMDREQRVKLVDQLNMNSNFTFDFIALIVLSTMIAAFGLVQNSGAVVIGAMLVAPLMTPLVGVGFSLVQGNERLVRSALRSVIFGFAIAFAMGILVGLFLQAGWATGLLPNSIDTTNSELQARGHPTLLDWFVAFVSGIAAAYAIGRPNLLSALPGVAIAAALVPPIATSGLALSILDFQLSIGALLLFFTNIVAIALGTAITFWAVGVDSRATAKKQEGRSAISWPRYLFLAFVMISILLAGAMSMRNGTMSEDRPPVKKLEYLR